MQHSARPVVEHVGLWRTPTTTAAGLLMMILLKHSGRSHQTRGADRAAEFLRLAPTWLRSGLWLGFEVHNVAIYLPGIYVYV